MQKTISVNVGSNDDDVMRPSTGITYVFALDGNDEIRDGNAPIADRYFGQGGDDLIFTNGGKDRLFGGTGDDEFISSNFANFRVRGGAGQDTLDMMVLHGTELFIHEGRHEKDVIKVKDADSGDLVQKVVMHDVEEFTWHMVG